MATVNFVLRSEKKGQFAKVFIRFRDGRKVDYFIPTDFRILPELWNVKSQSFKRGISFTDSFSEKDKVKLEDDFRDFKSWVLKNYNNKATEGSNITKEWLITVVNSYFNKTKQDEDLNGYIDRFIKEIETGSKLYNHNNRIERYKLSTVKNYKGFQEQFNLFQKDIVRRLNFDDITIDLYDQFLIYFNKKSYSPNTIGRHIKTLKVIMRNARDEGLHHNNEIDRKKFRSIKVPVQNIYLSETELGKLYELDLSDKTEWDLARDVFLIGCYTAQRFSDYSRIRKENLRELNDGTKVIDLIQKKTGEQVLIPIRPELMKLLEKYDFNLPKTFEQKVNKRIKDVGEKAKIVEPVVQEVIRGGLKVTSEIPKNKLIKTHTARRTGCTNMYLAGIPIIGIMKISGHKSEREFLSYIKISKEETAITLQNHPYFTQNHLKVVS
jgi:integrase